MSRANEKVSLPAVYTHEGARAVKIDSERQLRRSVASCMLWEDTFYEDGVDIADRIRALVPQTRPEYAAAVAYEARTRMHLRHVPLLVVAAMTFHPEHKALVSRLLPDVIQRPDEINEFLAIYFKIGSKTLSAQVKKGLARAFLKFGEYAIAKHNQKDRVWKLRDAAFLSHPKAGAEKELGIVIAKLVNKTFFPEETKAGFKVKEEYGLGEYSPLKIPDTWEVALSAGADKKSTFERLMKEGKLGALAFLRNLRNMKEGGVNPSLIRVYAQGLKVERVLPFRFISAARAVPGFEDVLEPMMFRCLADHPKLPGKTAIVVDGSGSMDSIVSSKSDLTRSDAAGALAILIREVCEHVVVIRFGNTARVVAPRRGFALAELLKYGNESTNTEFAIKLAAAEGYDRIIVVTDEQSHQQIPLPQTKLAYFVNVAPYKNGIGYGPWTHIDGWSEAILDYIQENERA